MEEMTEKEKQDRRPIYSPAKFVKTVWNLLSFWSNGSQQDAHEFLQYTIHFINECDLFIRKLQQQYQIKLEEDDETETNLETTTTTTKIDRRRKEFRNIKIDVMTEKLSDRLIKSIPTPESLPAAATTTTTIMNNSLLRTPTKGGASTTTTSLDECCQDLIIKNSSHLLIDEKDLVSKCLKETINNEFISTLTNKNKKTKLIKDETIHAHTINLNDSINSIIILDSDLDDDEEDEDEQEQKQQEPAILIKELKISIEKLNIETILKNNNLKLSNQSKRYLIDKQSHSFLQNDTISSRKEQSISDRTRRKKSLIIDNDIDLDAIIPVKPKLRSTNNQFITTTTTTATTASPAELLRKYYSITNNNNNSNNNNGGYTCEMDKLFKGSSITVTQCLECENLRKSPETFYDRSIPLVDNNNKINNTYDDDDLNWISKCLSNESYLNENSKYMCDKCASKQEAKIYTQYTQMPNILILHLLSYGITSSIDGNLNAQKLNNRSRLVNYFDYLSTASSSSLSNYSKLLSSPVKNNNINSNNNNNNLKRKLINESSSLKDHFNLFAVVMHSGTNLNSGHYTAYVNYRIICNNNYISSNSINGKFIYFFFSLLIDSFLVRKFHFITKKYS